jgi:hypothetical protein
MSYTRTETITIEQTETTTKKPTLSFTTLFRTKTSPGQPWPTPPDHTTTNTDDDDNGCCCFSRKRK